MTGTPPRAVVDIGSEGLSGLHLTHSLERRGADWAWETATPGVGVALVQVPLAAQRGDVGTARQGYRGCWPLGLQHLSKAPPRLDWSAQSQGHDSPGPASACHSKPPNHCLLLVQLCSHTEFSKSGQPCVPGAQCGPSPRRLFSECLGQARGLSSWVGFQAQGVAPSCGLAWDAVKRHGRPVGLGCREGS